MSRGLFVLSRLMLDTSTIKWTQAKALGGMGGTGRPSPLWPVGPVEPRPDGAGGVVVVDAPFGGKGADDIEPVMPRRVASPRRPGTAVVLDFDLSVIASIWF